MVFGIIGVGCLAIAGNEVVNEFERNTGRASASDYEIEEGACTVSDFGSITADGKITNTSSKDQGFQIEYRFLDPDGVQLSVDSNFTDSIVQGQTATYSVIGLTSDVPEGSTCVFNEVSYTIFDNEGGN